MWLFTRLSPKRLFISFVPHGFKFPISTLSKVALMREVTVATFSSQKHRHCSKMNNEASNLDNCSEIEIPTAGIIVIGDEILKGQTQDTNTNFLAKKLHSFGVKLCRVSVIPDDLSIIAEEVAKFSNQYTFVITSGGIGPTHDDITFEGVAAAFGEKVIPHPEIVAFIKEWFKTNDLSSPAMKMAHIPESAVLHYGEDKIKGIKSLYPVIGVRNVTIFPGVPHLLQKAFDLLGKTLFYRPGVGFHVRKLFLTEDEVAVATILNETVKEFPNVTFGSYPKLFHSYYKTKITMEAYDPRLVEEAEAALRRNMGKDIIIEYNPDTISSPEYHIEKLVSSVPSLSSPVKEAVGILEQCFDRYRPEEITVCYNGGKDCLVVLHLAQAIIHRRFPKTKLQAVYITENNAFPQVTEFVQQSVVRYGLDCTVLPGPMKEALADLLVKKPQIKAVIMGTRRNDPYADQLDYFTPTDNNWPPMMRVNAMINWSYKNVWDFLRGLYLPYCTLYDRGYTSLGSQDNTLPNPALQTTDRIGRIIYLPAHMLTEPSLERKGRISSKQ